MELLTVAKEPPDKLYKPNNNNINGDVEYTFYWTLFPFKIKKDFNSILICFLSKF